MNYIKINVIIIKYSALYTDMVLTFQFVFETLFGKVLKATLSKTGKSHNNVNQSLLHFLYGKPFLIFILYPFV